MEVDEIAAAVDSAKGPLSGKAMKVKLEEATVAKRAKQGLAPRRQDH